MLSFTLAAIGFVLAGTNAACEQAPPPKSSERATQVDGHERLEWDQAGPSLSVVSGYRYIAVVGRQPNDLKDVKCAAKPSGDGFVCSSSLPSLKPGAHEVWVIAVAIDEKRVLVSRWNSPLTLVKQ